MVSFERFCMADVTIGHFEEILKAYGASRETAGKVNRIFSQGSQRHADPQYEAVVAGFIENNAIEGLFETINPDSLGIVVHPADRKAVAMAVLDRKGFEVMAKDKDVGDEIVDAIARRPGTQQAVVMKSGPASVSKVISYLERPETSLWILDHDNRLFMFSRGPNWDKMIGVHNSMKDRHASIKAETEASLAARKPAPAEEVQVSAPEVAAPASPVAAAGSDVPAAGKVDSDDKTDEVVTIPATQTEPAAPEVTGGGNGGEEDDEDDDEDEDDDGDDAAYPKGKAPSGKPSFFVGTRKLPRILKEEEVAEMMRISKPMQRDSILLRCMYFLGMSNAEAQNFKVEDIDSVNNTVRIHEGKNRRDRTLPVPVELMNDLKDFLGMRTDGYVIRGRDKKANRLSDRHIRRIVKGYAKEANVRSYDEIHPHTLRHSYATHLLNHGTPLETVQSILGHERMETTAIYSYVHSQAVKEKIENALSS
jgi:hypothetical protein